MSHCSLSVLLLGQKNNLLNINKAMFFLPSMQIYHRSRRGNGIFLLENMWCVYKVIHKERSRRWSLFFGGKEGRLQRIFSQFPIPSGSFLMHSVRRSELMVQVSHQWTVRSNTFICSNQDWFMNRTKETKYAMKVRVVDFFFPDE